MLEYATDEYPRIGDLKEAHRQIHEVGQDINEARRRADAHWAIFNIQQNVSQCPVRSHAVAALASPMRRLTHAPH